MHPIHLSGINLGRPERLYRLQQPELPPSGDYYFLSNDTLRVHPINRTMLRRPLWRRPRLQSQRQSAGPNAGGPSGQKQGAGNNGDPPLLFWGIGNPHFFHVLAAAHHYRPIGRIIAVDNNPAQLRHFVHIMHLILAARNRIDFLERLFCLRFNDRARQALRDLRPGDPCVIRGGKTRDPFFQLERTLWTNCSFDAASFRHTYHLDVRPTEQGLHIRSKTIGELDSYYATLVCAARNQYDAWPFTAAFGSGFLADEPTFRRLQALLGRVPVYAVLADICQAYEPIVMSNRYLPMIFWASNVLCAWFVERHPPLSRLTRDLVRWGTQREPFFPEVELTILQDERTRRALPAEVDNRRCRRPRRRLSIHSQTFRRLCRYLDGYNNLEVVAVPAWIAQDGGTSKLPNTAYITHHDFLRLSPAKRYDTILLHILLGHGVPPAEFQTIAQRAKQQASQLIVLEHHRRSRDFRNAGIGTTVEAIRAMLGRESILDFGPGQKCADRNLIIVYRQT